jgi:endonuclease/exonuclease/phosphatase family metal-dependent hydrolase
MEPAALFLIIATYNIRLDTPADGANAWPHRRDAMADFIQTEQWDAFGLQEALRRQIDDLSERLPDYAWVGVGRDDGDRGGEYSPIFYRRDRFELIDSGTFWLSETPEQAGRRGWDAAYPRICTWARLKDRRTGVVFGLLNTHFDHQGALARAESAALLRKRADELFPDPVPAIMLGDFNATRDEPPLRTLLMESASPAARSWQEASEIAGEVSGPGGTYNAFEAVPTEGRIDFILLRGWTVEGHRVLDPRVDGRFVSDHLPVVARVRLAVPRP